MDEGVATASRGGPEVTGVGWSLPCSLSSLLAMNCRARAEGLARRLQSRVRIGSNGSSAFEETSLVNPGPEDHYASMEYRHSTQGPEDHYAALEYRHSSFDGTHMDLLEDSKLRPIHVVTSEPTLHLCLPSPPPLGNLPEQDSDVYYDFDLASPDEVLEGEEEDEEEQQQQQQAHQQQQQEVEEHQHNEAGERPESGCVTSVTSPVMFDNERDDEESEEADSATPGELFPPEESLVCSPDADLRAVRQLLSYSSLTDALSSTAEPAANYGSCKQADNYGIYEQGDNSGTCEQDTDYSTCAQVDTSNFENIDSSNYEHGDNYGTCEEGGKYGTCEDTCEVVDNYGICEEVDNHDTCEEVDNHDTCEVDNHGTCEVDNHGTCEEVDNYDTCEDTCEVVDNHDTCEEVDNYGTCEVVDNHDTCEEVDNYGTCEDTCEVVDNHDTCEEVDNYGTCEDTCEVDNHDTCEVDNHDTCEVDNYGTCEVDNYGTCEEVDNHDTCEVDNHDTCEVDNYGTCEVDNYGTCEEVDNYGTCEEVDNYDTCEVDNHDTCEEVDNHDTCEEVDNYGTCEEVDNHDTCEVDNYGTCEVDNYGTCEEVDNHDTCEVDNHDTCEVDNYDTCEVDNHDTCEEVDNYGTCEVDNHDTCEVDNYGTCEEVDNHDTCEVDNYDTCEVDNHDTCEVDNYGTCEEVDNHDTCEVDNYGTCEVVDNHDTCEVDNHDTCEVDNYDTCEVDNHDTCEVDNYGTCEVDNHDTCEVDNHDTCEVDNHDTCEEVDNHDTCEVDNYGTCEVDNHDTCEVDNHDTCEVDNYGTCEEVNNHDTCEEVDNHDTCEVVDNHDTCEVDNHDTCEVDNYGTCEEVDNHDTCEVDNYGTCEVVDNHDTCEVDNHDTCEVDNHDTCEEVDNHDTCEVDNYGTCEQVDNYGTCEQVDNYGTCEEVDNHDPCEQVNNHGTCEQGDNYDTSEQGGNSNCEQRDKYGTFEQGDNSSCEPGDNKVTSEQSEPCVQSDEHEVAGCERRGCACACCDSEQGAHEGSTQVAGVEPLPVSGTEGAGEAVPGWCPTTGSALVTSPVAKSGPDQCHASRGTAPVGPTLSPDSNPSGSTLTHCASSAYTNSDQEISEACRVEHCVMIDNEGQNKVDEGHEPTQEWEGVDGQRAAGFVASVTVKYSVIETGFTDGDGKPEMAPRWDDETIVKTSPEIEAVPRAISGWTPPVADSHLYTPSEEPRAAMEARDDEADLRVHDEIFSMDLDNEEIETLDEDAEGNEEEVENEEDIEEETILTGKFRNIRGYTERVRRLSEEAEDRPPSVTVISYVEESMSQPEEASQVAEVKDVVEEHVCSVELASQLSNLQVEDVGIQVDAGDTEESSDEAENRSSEETDPERVEDFKMRIKRSSSLKCGKTPPGTPGRKKIVRFADMLGLDLAAVRTFLGGGVPHVPRSAFWDLQVENEAAAASSGYTCQVTEPPIPRRLLTPLFQQPGTQINFLERVRNQRVVVENVEVGDDMSVRGFVRVLNLDFHKSVCVRYTFDHWRNFHEATATYVPGSYDGLTDRFTFLLWGSFLQDNGALAFCVRYQTLGQEFWDNNHGRNYVLQCYMTPNIPGGRVASPRPQNSTSVQQHYSGGGQSSARSDYNCFVGSPTTPSDPWVTTFF
ncbi:uncharacterized protein [Procambarus clarkii]